MATFIFALCMSELRCHGLTTKTLTPAQRVQHRTEHSQRLQRLAMCCEIVA